MTQGASNNGTVHDLDALLASRILAPKKVKLLGYVYTVRTDLTGEEATKYYALAGEKKDIEALTLLVGARDAKKLNAVLDKLPSVHMNAVVQELMVISGVAVGVPQTKVEAAGESEAS